MSDEEMHFAHLPEKGGWTEVEKDFDLEFHKIDNAARIVIEGLVAAYIVRHAHDNIDAKKMLDKVLEYVSDSLVLAFERGKAVARMEAKQQAEPPRQKRKYTRRIKPTEKPTKRRYRRRKAKGIA